MLINTLITHMIHINLSTIFYSHIEHSPTKTVYIRHYMHTHTHTHQGMTIRTARLPGAGNLLGRAGEDLSGLPNPASCYHFFIDFFVDSIIFQFKHQISSHCDSFCFAVPQSQHQFPFTSSDRPTSVS